MMKNLTILLREAAIQIREKAMDQPNFEYIIVINTGKNIQKILVENYRF